MLRQKILKRCKSVRRNIKRRDFNIGEESVEIFGLEYDFGERLVTHALAKHRATVESYLLVFIPAGRKYAQTLSASSARQIMAKFNNNKYNQ